MDLKDYQVILDTDIGDDIDDAFALALAIKRGVPLVAVTTVFKNTGLRAKQAREMLATSGLNIPVYAGEVYPLNGVITGFQSDSGDLATIKPCQYGDEMAHYSYGLNASEMIVRLAKTYTKKLILVTIGPLTNIARALEIDPSIACDIKAIYAMGGCYTRVQPEWNVLCDVEAYDKVFASGIPFYGVGLDMTLQCPLEEDLFSSLKASQDPINQKIMVWFDRWVDYFHFEKSVLHDPLALSSLIEDDICTFTPKYAKVVLDGEQRSSILTSDEPLPGYYLINAATSVNKNKFYDLIKKTFLN